MTAPQRPLTCPSDVSAHRVLRRRYRLLRPGPDGLPRELVVTGPIDAIHESTFGVIGAGATVIGADGPHAISDILPGERLRGRDGRLSRVAWAASWLAPPPGGSVSPRPLLLRVAAGALGPGRPMADLVLSRHAVLLGHDGRRIPVADLADEDAITPIRPRSAVELHVVVPEDSVEVIVEGLALDTAGMRSRLARILGSSMPAAASAPGGDKRPVPVVPLGASS